MSDFSSANKRFKRASDSIVASNTFCPISLLPDAVLDSIFSFVGPGQYRFVAGTSRHFRRVYESNQDRSKDAFWSTAATSVTSAELVLEDYKLLEKEKEDTMTALHMIVIQAIKDGNVDALKWAEQHGFNASWLSLHSRFSLIGRCGHVNVLDWVDSLPVRWDYECLIRGVVVAGNVSVLEWLHGSRRLSLDDNKDHIWNLSGEYGQVSILQWMKDVNLIPASCWGISSSAARKGHVSALGWLAGNRRQAFRRPHAAIIAWGGLTGGHITALDWAKGHGCALNENFCEAAAALGDLAALQWLRENDCPWNGWVIHYAARDGHNHIVEWARENGCPEPEPQI